MKRFQVRAWHANSVQRGLLDTEERLIRASTNGPYMSASRPSLR